MATPAECRYACMVETNAMFTNRHAFMSSTPAVPDLNRFYIQHNKHISQVTHPEIYHLNITPNLQNSYLHSAAQLYNFWVSMYTRYIMVQTQSKKCQNGNDMTSHSHVLFCTLTGVARYRFPTKTTTSASFRPKMSHVYSTIHTISPEGKKSINACAISKNNQPINYEPTSHVIRHNYACQDISCLQLSNSTVCHSQIYK